MKAKTWALALCVAAVAAPAATAPAALKSAAIVKPAAADCAKLATAYDFEDRRIALTGVEGQMDDSAVRGTEREIKILNWRVEKLMLIELMRAQSCPVPSSVTGDVEYMGKAVACVAAKVNRAVIDAPECRILDWTPSTPENPDTHSSH